MSQSLPPWSLHWSSDGELSPMDRDDLAHLFLAFHRPGMAPPSRRAPPKIYYFPIVKP
jgi:hypothetical protein